MGCGCKENGVVVSLVLVKARESNLKKVIRNLVNQSIKPDKIHVWISKEPFYMDDGFDEKPKLKCPRAKIHWTPNIGALRKFIPVLNKYWFNPEQIIILTDDDHIWYKDMIKDILKWKKLKSVLSTAGNNYIDGNPNNWKKQWFHGNTIKNPRRCDIISTGYGCLIKPKFFSREIFDWEKYKDLGLPYDDEFWFNAMLAKNNILRFVVPTKQKRDKLEHHGVDMFKSKPSRQCKANITKEFKKIIMSV